ncbi:MAG: transposase, partial [Candidatus Hydrothermarchaeales archaeon]
EVEVSIAEESIESEDVRLLMSIPGIDYYTAMLFINEIGDIKRFSSAAKLVSWLGLAPRVHQSGGTGYNGRITKEGSPRVRSSIVQSARVAVRWDEHFKGKYRRIKTRRGDGKAIVAVAREMVVAMYHMLTRMERYRFSSEAFVKEKYKRLERRVGNADKIRGRTPAGALSS